MLNAIFTLDYEIHGNGEGSPAELMVEPTYRLMDCLEDYGAKLTIMADVAEILKFKEYRERTGRDDFHYQAIADQLRHAIERGHDVQLHLHASYFKATFNGSHWEQNWSEYNFAGLSQERLNEIIGIGKRYLESLLKPVRPEYECVAFRAANWAVSPSRNVVRALVENEIHLDTSVFKHGHRSGLVSFDYANAHSELIPWTVHEEDICQEDATGKLVEVPIYCEKRWLGAFLTLNRVYRVWTSRKHPIGEGPATINEDRPATGVVARVKRKLSMVLRVHPWKADFNQCSGQQLIRAIARSARRHDPNGRKNLPFVLIGHSKLFTRFNEWSLRPFLRFIRRNPERFAFGTFSSSNYRSALQETFAQVEVS